ncbi:hypothetical protein QCA50_019973 [Cerrena zonata]|uniref:Uncharacterized protein n=1 Tax=Cerrena zonata TaxID=2478898 RepID=A0AAW0FDJ5_9APHY
MMCRCGTLLPLSNTDGEPLTNSVRALSDISNIPSSLWTQIPLQFLTIGHLYRLPNYTPRCNAKGNRIIATVVRRNGARREDEPEDCSHFIFIVLQYVAEGVTYADSSQIQHIRLDEMAKREKRRASRMDAERRRFGGWILEVSDEQQR